MSVGFTEIVSDCGGGGAVRVEVTVGGFGGGIGGGGERGECPFAMIAASTAAAAFVRKLHSLGALNSLRTQHSLQGQRLRRRRWLW